MEAWRDPNPLSEEAIKASEQGLYDLFVKEYSPKRKKHHAAYEQAFKTAVHDKQLYLADLLSEVRSKDFFGDIGDYIIKKDLLIQMFHYVLEKGSFRDIRVYSKVDRLSWKEVFNEVQQSKKFKNNTDMLSGIVSHIISVYKSHALENNNFYLIPLLADRREDVFKTLLEKDILHTPLIEHIVALTKEQGAEATPIAALLQAELRKRDMIAAGIDTDRTEQWVTLGRNAAIQKRTFPDLSSTITREFNFQSQTVLVKIKDADGLCCTETPFGHYDPSALQLAYKELCDRVPNPAPFKPEKRKERLDFSIPEKRGDL